MLTAVISIEQIVLSTLLSLTCINLFLVSCDVPFLRKRITTFHEFINLLVAVIMGVAFLRRQRVQPIL